jgi:hypothetical protein
MTVRSASTGSEPAPNPPADPAESVAGYRDLAEIGHGGFSVVYRAVQESFERAVALKVLTVGSDEDARRRFRREVRLASRLSGHPHVVTVLDTGTTASGRPYLAMDLYDGGSMRDRLRRSGPLSPAQTAAAGAKVAEALAAAHTLGVLHRDVKPNNILISRFGEPALADFGVSCLLDSSSSASVLDVFSPQHAAPELMTRGVLTASSDIYALGSTLYQLLTGRPPFGGEGRDVRSIMWRAVSEPPPRPECPELPGLADAIVRAMAKEPEERFADAAEFARTLRALIPDGAPALPMPDAASSGGPDARSGATKTAAEAGTGAGVAGAGAASNVAADAAFDIEFDIEPDTSTAGRLRSSDETMVRPDRADPVGRPGPVAGGRGDRGDRVDRGEPDAEQSGVRRARKPLAVAGAILLLGAAAWAVIASQGPSASTPEAASSHEPTATAPSSASAVRLPTAPTATATATARRSSAPAALSGATASAGGHAKPTPSASAASGGSLLSLPGSYHRLQNAQSGSCLAQPAGGSASAQAACSNDQTQSWQYSLSLSGILAAGDDELVNEQSGQCLTAGSSGRILVQACDGGSAQLWSKVDESGASKEFQNAGNGQCLQSSGAVVSYGPCDANDRADLWSDGTS